MPKARHAFGSLHGLPEAEVDRSVRNDGRTLEFVNGTFCPLPLRTLTPLSRIMLPTNTRHRAGLSVQVMSAMSSERSGPANQWEMRVDRIAKDKGAKQVAAAQLPRACRHRDYATFWPRAKTTVVCAPTGGGRASETQADSRGQLLDCSVESIPRTGIPA
jgi:hypothetical protein